MTPPPEPADTFSLLRARPGDPPNIRALRFAVIGMGAILILGFATVIARIVHLTTRPVASGETATSTPPRPPAQPSTLAKTAYTLPAGAKILSQSLSGTRLSVHYVADEEETIMVLDLETGEPAGRIQFHKLKK